MKSVLITGAGSGLGRGTAIDSRRQGIAYSRRLNSGRKPLIYRRRSRSSASATSWSSTSWTCCDERDVKHAMGLPFDTL